MLDRYPPFIRTFLVGTPAPSASLTERSSATWSLTCTHISSHSRLSSNDRAGYRSRGRGDPEWAAQCGRDFWLALSNLRDRNVHIDRVLQVSCLSSAARRAMRQGWSQGSWNGRFDISSFLPHIPMLLRHLLLVIPPDCPTSSDPILVDSPTLVPLHISSLTHWSAPHPGS